MNRAHDVGGRPGAGPVPVEADQPWSAWWQQLAMALAALTARAAGVNGDALRHFSEQFTPEDYTRSGSAGRWLVVAERCAVEGGLVAEGEVFDRAARRAEGREPAAGYPEPRRTLAARARGVGHSKRDPGASRPRFAIGDGVVVADHRPTGHTRLPAYLRGRHGVVARLNGFWVYPDTNAHDDGEQPTWVYSVRFAAADLWPDATAQHVCADLFEPYLTPAPTEASDD